jgi:hypothetical protein
MTLQYGYYPYYTTGAQQAQQLSSYIGAYQTPQSQQLQYYASQPSLSQNSDNDVQFNQASVATNWLNQGTNYNPYAQQQYNSVTQNYATSPGYTTPYQYPAETSSQKTYTEQSVKSKKTEYESRASSRASNLNQQALSEDLNQLTPQIEAAYEAANGKRRQPVIKRQVITMPGEPGRVQQVVRRLPTPTPDIIERVFIVKPQRDTINLVIERPTTPPCLYRDKTVYGKSRRPIINPKVVTVHPTNYPQIEPSYQQQVEQSQAYPQIEQSQYQQNVQAIDYSTLQQQQQQVQGSDMPGSYLIAPLNVYNENNNNSNNLNTTVQSQNEQSSRQPTFSTQVLQPYNPPMLDQYTPQMPSYQYQPMQNYY